MSIPRPRRVLFAPVGIFKYIEIKMATADSYCFRPSADELPMSASASIKLLRVFRPMVYSPMTSLVFCMTLKREGRTG
jgi:hypothetical protein